MNACNPDTALRQNSGQDIQVVSEGKVVAQKLASYLEKHLEAETRLTKNSQKKLGVVAVVFGTHYFSFRFSF